MNDKSTTAEEAVGPERAATDWVEGGWDIDQSVEFAKRLKRLNVDLVDVSSGGALPHARVPVTPDYQVPFARRIRKEAKILTGAVGKITEFEQADQIVRAGDADLVMLARQILRDPYWPLHAEAALGAEPDWPVQYG
jgi:2,4-dienoyl-CoA reductase-like NADH-dependent reductase (Old Yellow Enzyme family)